MGNKQRGSDGRFVSSVDLDGALSADSPMAKVLASASASAVSDAVGVDVEDVSADAPTDADMPTDAPTVEAMDTPTDALDGMPLGVLESDTNESHSDVEDAEDVEGADVERSRPRSRDVRRSDVKSLIASRRSESDRRMGTEVKGFGARAVVASRKAGSSLGSARSVIRDRLSGNLRGGVGGSKCTTKVIG